jgi:hypothetical protein
VAPALKSDGAVVGARRTLSNAYRGRLAYSPFLPKGMSRMRTKELSRMQRSSRRCIGWAPPPVSPVRQTGCPTLAAVIFCSLWRAARPLDVLLFEEPALSSLVRHSLGVRMPAQLLVVCLETVRASL